MREETREGGREGEGRGRGERRRGREGGGGGERRDEGGREEGRGGREGKEALLRAHRRDRPAEVERDEREEPCTHITLHHTHIA